MSYTGHRAITIYMMTSVTVCGILGAVERMTHERAGRGA